MSLKEIIKLTLPVNSNQNLIQRPSTAPITLLEYGDYQCPYCERANPIIKQVQKHLSNKLQFVFHNFPITQIHLQAQHEAEADEIARQRRISFGICLIIYMNTNKPLMTIIWRNMSSRIGGNFYEQCASGTSASQSSC